jgi:serine/threonine protein phosphatase 1
MFFCYHSKKEKIVQKHYVIGDVHAEYKTLLALVAKLPKDARLIFVGDLISRGSDGRRVIHFVKENAFYCIKGNHEEYFLKFGSLFFDAMNKRVEGSSLVWAYTHLSSTLRSYGLLRDNSTEVILNQKGIEEMKRDMEWIAKRPVYFEMGHVKGYTLPVVVTHSPVDKYWFFKDTHPEYFEFYAMNNRYIPTASSPIFNIYGHVPRKEVLIGSNFVSLDTGCGRGEDKRLSAYCIETREVIWVKSVG